MLVHGTILWPIIVQKANKYQCRGYDPSPLSRGDGPRGARAAAKSIFSSIIANRVPCPSCWML